MKQIAIIGAGLSGLSMADFLKEKAHITLFEKARGVSGRMSTRRADIYSFDHGAQYFTAKTPAFKSFIKPLIKQGTIVEWNPHYAQFDGEQQIHPKSFEPRTTRYVGSPGMNAIAKFLAQGLNIHLNTKIESIEKTGHKWALTDAKEQTYTDFDWVICTAPAPQIIDILPKCFKHHTAIEAIKMQACFSLMLGFEHPLNLGFESAHIRNADLSWIAINSHKFGRSAYPTLVVHSAPSYAEQHLESDRGQVMKEMMTKTNALVGFDTNIAAHKTLHSWRYANNLCPDAKHRIFLDDANQLAACGDWCVGGRVEGAFTAAYMLMKAIKEVL